MGLKITKIQTELFGLGDSLFDFIIRHCQKPSERTVLSVTSKIASLSEKRTIPKSQIQKIDLVKKEADVYLGEIMHGVSLTIKEGLFIPSAGIDESNADGDFYILYPNDPNGLTHQLYVELKSHWGLKQFGLILTDSHTHPLRRGVTGIALASAGFEPVHELVGEKDLFGKPFKYSAVNVADSLATAATFLMGEGQERCPMAWIENAQIQFTDSPKSKIQIPMEKDLYFPIYQALMERSKGVSP